MPEKKEPASRMYGHGFDAAAFETKWEHEIMEIKNKTWTKTTTGK